MSKQLFCIEKHIVPKQTSPVRMSDYTGGIFVTISSRKGMKKAICKGLVRVNGKVARTGDVLYGGENIQLFQPKIESSKPTIELAVDVIYEDDYLALVNKPAGIVVSGNKKWTLENALPNNLKKSTQKDALPRPEPIHRLDYPTSGIILIGKTFDSVVRLNKMFENREIQKYYAAVTIKSMANNSGTVETTIEEKQCKSSYEVIARVDSPRFESLNLVRLNPHTGRKHQLRIHCASIGNPILGDLEHGEEGLILKGKGLYLHAFSLQFVHPYTKEDLSLSIPMPKKFTKLFPDAAL